MTSNSRARLALLVAAPALRADRRRIEDARARRDARLAIGSRDARRGPRASGSPPSTSPRNSPASARARCRAAATCSCRSSSRPAAATAARASRSRATAAAPRASPRARCRRSPSLTMPRSPAPRSSPATASSCRSRRASATTATQRSTSRTRSSSSCATSPRTPIRRRGPSWPATPTCGTRRWRRGSGARGRCWSSPGRARRMPARRFRCPSTRRWRGPASRPPASAARWRDALFVGRQRARCAMSNRSSTAAIRTSPAFRFRASR